MTERAIQIPFIVSTGVTTAIRTRNGTTLSSIAIITVKTDAVSTPYSFSSTCTITTTTNLTTVTASATTTTTLWKMPRECSASVVPMLRVSDAVIDFRSVLFLDTYCDLRGPPRHVRRNNNLFAWR